MRIGLSFDLKEAVPEETEQPEDALEEYDSIETVELIARALESEGHSTVKLGGGREFLANILHEKVDFVFNIAEGLGNYRSREAQLPSVLEMLNIPYTGSDPLCLAVCLDKLLTKKIVALAGIPTPKWLVADSITEIKNLSWSGFAFPAFVKPAFEGSSKGIHGNSLVENREQAIAVMRELLETYRQPVMIEEFIDGEEVTVGIIGNNPPGFVEPLRVVPRKKDKYFVYTLDVKRDWEQLVDYEWPVQLPSEVIKNLKQAASKSFTELGCRDFARADFRISHDGTPYFLEINPLAGLSTHSDLYLLTKIMGWEHAALILAIFHAALERYPQCRKK